MTNEIFRNTLLEANQMCRSAYAIAEREGTATNWEAFRKRLYEALAMQNDVIMSTGGYTPIDAFDAPASGMSA